MRAPDAIGPTYCRKCSDRRMSIIWKRDNVCVTICLTCGTRHSLWINKEKRKP